MKVFNSVSDLQAASLTAGQLTQTKRYFAGQDGGGATYLIKTAVDYAGTPDEYGDHTLANGNVAVLQTEGSVNVKQYGFVTDGSDNYDAAQALIRNAGAPRRSIFFPSGTYTFSVFNPNNCDIVGEDATLSFEYDATKSVVMGQITNCYIRGLTFASTETDLENQRVTADGSTFENCKFTGWRNPTNSNAWGLYLKDQSNVRVINCGFDDNTQSDIAIVDDVDNVVIENCYPLSSTFVINCEPNSSSVVNKGILINACDLSALYLLENGTGGTANKNITVNNCDIGTLKYDGARATITDCRITSFSTETEAYFGEVKFKNTLALGPNLLEDPYFSNIAFSSSAATTDSNKWYMNSRSGAIGGDQLDPLEENGIRFTRINPNNLLGAINFTHLTPLSLTAGDNLLIAVTGRTVNGNSAAFIQFNEFGGTNWNGRLFRQSNDGYGYFTTEYFVVPIGTTADFYIKVGTWTSTTNSVDIYSITAHKILGAGGNEDVVLGKFHSNLYGVRELLPVATLPTFSDANVRSIQTGDRATVSSTGVTSYWNGSAWVAM